ncbi:MAG: hypothetical protein HQ517_00925 [SAR324 cluster bacterium]|nr:hypothetical protein [SAR324 cluster bacterium]
MKRLLLGGIIFFLGWNGGFLFGADQEVIDENNQYGGRTIEIPNKDGSFIREYYDDDEIKLKKEIIFGVDYPVDNGLERIIIHYAFEKKVEEEKIFSNRVAETTLIKKTIVHFDRFSDPDDKKAITKTENHFLDSYNGYNVIYREKGLKTKIEWFYPLNVDGIEKNVIYFDDKEMGTKVETFFTEKTRREKGTFRRVYYNEFSPDRYFRKVRQEMYFTDSYTEQNNGVASQIEIFHYYSQNEFTSEINRFNKKGEMITESKK